MSDPKEMITRPLILLSGPEQLISQLQSISTVRLWRGIRDGRRKSPLVQLVVAKV